MKRHLTLLPMLLLVAVACNDGNASLAPPATTTTTTEAPATTTPQSPTTTAVKTDTQIAMEAIAAWNTLELDAFLAFFTDDATIRLRSRSGLEVAWGMDWPARAPDVRDELEFLMDLGDLAVVQKCELDGRGRVLCRAISSDNLSGAVGATYEGEWVFSFADGLIRRLSWKTIEASGLPFTEDMVLWVEEAHPGVWLSTFAPPGGCTYGVTFNCHSSWLASAEVAATLLELGPEFIAQSDEYSPVG